MLNSSRVLIADDDPGMCASLASLLQSVEINAFTVNTGTDAVRAVAEHDFDLALLDVHLPDMSGLDILARIKSRCARTPVIIMTGSTAIDSAISALKRGAHDFLRKPFEADELLKTVDNALRQMSLAREKKRVERQLRRSEEKYRHLVQHCPDIIFALDNQKRFSFLSQTAATSLAVEAADLLGKAFDTLVHDADRDAAIRFLDGRRTGEVSGQGVELRLNRADGDVLTVEVNASRHRRGYHGIIRDVSERVQLQAQLGHARRMESLGTLAAGLAHDFNNLLMGIQGHCSLMALNLDEAHAHKHHLDAISRIVERAAGLTGQLLGCARGGKYLVAAVDLNDLVRKSVDMVSRTGTTVPIDVDCTQADLIVECDLTQIEQVIVNLLRNARQAMPDGGVISLRTGVVRLDRVQSDLYPLSPGTYARLSVTDTGVGIPSEDLDRIFDPFFSTRERGKGTGLGLASAYGIVQHHGGKITVKSDPGCETRFDVYLPLSDASATSSPSPAAGSARGAETILVVDDDATVVEIIQGLLERLGYRVIRCHSGEDAVWTVRQPANAVDLVILDMKMPGMDGAETFDRLHALQPHLPVLLCSGYALDSRAGELLRKGCCGFVQKPFHISEISEKIREALDGRGRGSRTLPEAITPIQPGREPYHARNSAQ